MKNNHKIIDKNNMADYLRRALWLSLNLILCSVIIYIPLNFNKSLEENDCYIDRIEYPQTFEDESWVNCSCDTPFCTQKCYCVKLFSSLNKTLVVQGDYSKYSKNCTFESNIIPYQLNFQPIISKYYNKTVACWYNDDSVKISNIYLNFNDKKMNRFFFLVAIFFVANLACFFIELSDNNNGQEIYEMNIPDEGIAL